MGWFSRGPSAQQVVDARAAAADARACIGYVNDSLRDHGHRWSNQKVQEFRMYRWKAQQALRKANKVLEQVDRTA